MANWYVKELSNLTQVSVQTLHHYDRIGLLIPSVRLSNGYRLYSEKDLLKLQQIIALKFFGFELSQIKTLLDREVDVLEHFAKQSEVLQKKAKLFSDASETLTTIVAECSEDKSLPWQTIIKLIEVYRMTQQLEQTWVGKVLNPDELKEYAKFEQYLKDDFTDEQRIAFEQGWANLANEINTNIDKDPSSAFGIDIGKRCMEWVNNFYGKKYIKLRNIIWEKGFKEGNVGEDYKLTPQGIIWLDKALDAYYGHQISNVLNQINQKSDKTVMDAWDSLMDDMFGDDQSSKDDIIKRVIKENYSPAIKHWLSKHYKI